MRRESRKRKHVKRVGRVTYDKNERFVFKKSATYLCRHLTRYSSIDNNTIEVICSIMGHEMKQIGELLLDRFPLSQKDEFEDELSECVMDPEDYGYVLKRMLGTIGTGSAKIFKREILKLLNEISQELNYVGLSDLEKNVMALKKMFSLTEQETEFCVFLYILSNNDIVEDFFVNHLQCQKFGGGKYLTNILALTRDQLNDVLCGTLNNISLFEMDRYTLCLNDDFQSLFESPSSRIVSKSFYFPIQGNTVPLEHHFVKQEETGYIIDLLTKKPDTSSHILLYGPPGTGKTSFSYGIAERLGIPAYGIRGAEENTTRNRRAAIIACLNMTNTGDGALIMVDEADNILNTRNSWFTRGETQDKGWLNQLLEEPGVRMIWITNTLCNIEESVMRRFAFSIHFEPFNVQQRIRLWENILRRNRVKRFFTQSDIIDFAGKYNVSAGAIDMAVKKAIESVPGSKGGFHKTVEIGIDAHQTLLNFGERQINKDKIEENYSLEGLNIDGDIQAVICQLERLDYFLHNSEQDETMNMNLLFYGPPGTGKSELARYMAKHLKRKIICKRVSDLQNKWVGDSEKNIKHAFAEAEAEKAILIIDEADSLLFRRDRAERSWEISFTNEFLTQMERFRGILVCTTNRVADLDHASIRRFNYKIGFDYLKPDGNLIFYRRLLSPLIKAPLDKGIQDALKRIPNLAPGDFKVVRDRYSFHQKDGLNHHVLVNALKQEAKMKNIHGGKEAIGF